MEQQIYRDCRYLAKIFGQIGSRRVLLVCGRSFDRLAFRSILEAISIPLVRFSDFSPNPQYEDVRKGVERFRTGKCDTILAVGGGSAIDTAKCIKLFCRMDPNSRYLEHEFEDTGIPLIALPTTAGTGSESTRYAVIYYNGEKQSVSHPSILPEYVILEPSALEWLPLYQKKCTMLDALCQGIEAWWSVNSTDESRELSRVAVTAIISNWRDYIERNDHAAAALIMEASNASGRAINIAETTAAHAMSYKLTSLYGIAHGHAVACCLPEVWEYIAGYTDKCVDPRGSAYLRSVLAEISSCLDLTGFQALLKELRMMPPVSGSKKTDLELLARSVNPGRLRNNPVALDHETLYGMYERIVLADEC